MKFKKSLVTLTAASSVALAGIPAAVAEEAPEAPATAEATTQPAEETAAANETAAAGDEAAEEGAAEGETAPAKGSADSEQGQKLKGSIDKLVGWDDSTSTIQKIKDVLGFIGKIVKIVL